MNQTTVIQQFIAKRSRLSALLYFLTGALTMLSFAPFGLYPVAAILLLPFFFACLFAERRAATRCGFWYGAGLFLTGTYWLYTSIHVFGQAPLWVAIFVMLGLVLIMGMYYAATAWLLHTLTAGNLLRLLLAAAPVWVTLEWLRGWVMSGFPWMTLGYSQIDSPLAGFAPLLGVYGVSLMLVLSASAVFVAGLASGRMRYLAVVVAVSPWIVGGALAQIVWSSAAGDAVRTTIIQGGVAQDQKWSREQYWPTLNLYQASLAAHRSSDLIVWPEVALPTITDRAEEYLSALQSEAALHRQSLLLGILERGTDGESIYNSMLLLSGDSRQVYRKRHLVPFGEYFPVPDFVREWMRMMSLPNSDLAAGADRQPLLVTDDGLTLAVAICYEDAYAAEQLYALPEASVLINVSNDAWFGDSIAPHQHLEIARMRALEVSRFVVRSTNNGISAFIGPDGTLLETGPQFEYVAMTRDITPLQGATPYATAGNWPVISSSLLLLGVLAWRRERKSAA